MPDYQKAKVYKLYSPSKNLTYIGSTTETLAQRLAKHKFCYKAYNKDNTKTYTSSYLVLDEEDYKIELLEEYACNNRSQLERKEGEYIKNNICVNQVIAGRTIKEYCIDNADKLREQRKQYKIANADILKEKDKQYYIANADKIREYSKQYNIANADKRKQYRITNADILKEKIKQYHIANADKIKEYKKQYYLKKKAEKAI